MRVELTTITPILAAQLLQRNSDNRVMSERQVEKLCKVIKDGKFKTTHQGVALSSAGRLLDGQHRLEAIKRVGQPVQMYVWYDVPEDTYSVLDAGYSRKIADRIRQDARHVALVTGIFRMARTSNIPVQEYEAALLLEIFRDGLHLFDVVPGVPKRKVESSACQAANVLRLQWLKNTGNEDGILRIQWLLDKIRTNEMVGAPPVIHTFLYQTLSDDSVTKRGSGYSRQQVEFLRTWKAFDPASENLKLLKILPQGREWKEVRLVFSEITKRVFE